MDGTPAEKKRHDKAGNRVELKFVKRPQMVQEYYNAMPATDVVNRNAQFLLGIEAAVRTSNPFTRMACTVIGTWFTNAWGMGRKWSAKYKNITSHEFVRHCILGGLFPKINEGNGNNVGDPFAVATNITHASTIDVNAVDPFVHTMQRFSAIPRYSAA